MDIKEKNLTGFINNDGYLMIHESDIYNELLANNIGRRVILNIQIQGRKKSSQLLGYYWGVVIKEVQKALYSQGSIYEGQEVDELLRNQIIITSDSVYNLIGQKIEKVKRISELDNVDLAEYIYQVKIWCAENLSLYIKDPIN